MIGPEEAIEWIERIGELELDPWQHSMMTSIFGMPIVANSYVPDDMIYVLADKTIVVQLVDSPVTPDEIVCGVPHGELIGSCSRCRAER